MSLVTTVFALSKPTPYKLIFFHEEIRWSSEGQVHSRRKISQPCRFDGEIFQCSFSSLLLLTHNGQRREKKQAFLIKLSLKAF